MQVHGREFKSIAELRRYEAQRICMCGHALSLHIQYAGEILTCVAKNCTCEHFTKPLPGGANVGVSPVVKPPN